MEIEITGYPKQMEFIKCQSEDQAFIAGLGSGKTHAGALKSLDYCLAYPGAWGIITAPTSRILETATILCYEKVFPIELIVKQVARPHPFWRLVNGCRLYFWSTDNPETIVGAEFAFSHMDEGSLSVYQAYLNIKKRLRQRTPDGEAYPTRLWITTTPRQLNWLYKEVYKPDSSIQAFNASTMDNTFIDEEQRSAYIGRLNLAGKEYEQEIEGKFVVLSGELLISADILNERLKECQEPLEIRDNGAVQIWKPPVVGVKYVAGADCSDEGGGGVNDLIILDAQTGEEMAEINADVSADQFAVACYNLCKEYNYALIAPERNGTTGGMVIQKLKDMAYDHIYIDADGREGWFTKPTAYFPKIDRFRMLTEYEEAVRLRRTVIRSSDAIGELSTFVRNEKGKYDHRDGYKSDRIMARAIAWQIRHSSQGSRRDFICIKRDATSYV